MIRRAGRGPIISCTMTIHLVSGLSIRIRRAARFRRPIVCTVAVASAKLATVRKMAFRNTLNGERFTTVARCFSARRVARSLSHQRRNVMEDSLPPNDERDETGKYDELIAAKDRVVMLALQDAERYYRTRGDLESEEASDNIIDEAFDEAVLNYVRAMAKLAIQNL